MKIFLNEHFLKLRMHEIQFGLFLSDDSETQDLTVFFREQAQYDMILQELRELKELVKDVQK